ncbi:hypothetical protein D9M68_316630 [compost metagenome]|jgi:hypothetical protein|uniref:hypothetical protein n=1 Tax=Sinorhizobium/Ensifer group TaxID=227292 RepID=UPI00071CC2DC|nr:hypothetical protein [Sinorhizobium sp. Sb3]KSV85205.1 hypothetical protein N183_01855 [Sinorhizobium sp. Sb3]
MKATVLIQSIYLLGLNNHPEAAKKWVSVMHSLGAMTGVAHSLSISTASKLDLILRQLESEHWDDINTSQGDRLSFATDLISALSDSWILASYEPIRAACEQLRDRDEQNSKLSDLHYRLALVRMPIAKAEIKDAKRQKPEMLLHPVGEGDPSPKSYAADGSYIVPKAVCGATGATVWYPIDLKVRQTVAICRRDLSDEFLALFE